jgi:XTP/dITP diphosphohydrolase
MSQTLLIGTSNRGKVLEYRQLLSEYPFELRTLNEFPSLQEVEETGNSFAENAILKARAGAIGTGLVTLADDSGLEIEALGGVPGIYSARYAGTGTSYAERMAKLLDGLERTGDESRRARFVCVIAVSNPIADRIETFEGICDGRIALEPHGVNGFGYDPIFVPDGFSETFGELPESIKHAISHRARAVAAARPYLLSLSDCSAFLLTRSVAIAVRSYLLGLAKQNKQT